MYLDLNFFVFLKRIISNIFFLKSHNPINCINRVKGTSLTFLLSVYLMYRKVNNYKDNIRETYVADYT